MKKNSDKKQTAPLTLPFLSSKQKYDWCVFSLILLLEDDVDILRKKAAFMILEIILGKEEAVALVGDEKPPVIDRNDPLVNKWKKQVLSKGKCERCGSTKNLQAHHILGWAEYPAGRIMASNGECICEDCHIQEHYYDKSYHLMKGRKERRVNNGKKGKTSKRQV